MKYLFWGIILLLGLWFETALSSYFRIAGLKVDVVLVLLLVLMLRWQSSAILFYGLFFGFMTDVLSHGMLGINGLSFFITIIIAKWIGKWLYDENLFSTFIFVGILSLVEGVIALLLLKILVIEIPWNHFFLKVIIPLAPIHGAIALIFYLGIVRLERYFHLQLEEDHPLYY